MLLLCDRFLSSRKEIEGKNVDTRKRKMDDLAKEANSGTNSSGTRGENADRENEMPDTLANEATDSTNNSENEGINVKNFGKLLFSMNFLYASYKQPTKYWNFLRSSVDVGNETLKKLANELPSDLNKSGNYYEDIKNYIISCKQKEEKISKLKKAHQELLTYDKNIFKDLRAYCENWDEASSMENHLKNFINRVHDLLKERNNFYRVIGILEKEKKEFEQKLKHENELKTSQIQALEWNIKHYSDINKRLEKENTDLKEFKGKWKETVQYIEEVQSTGYRAKYEDFESLISLARKKIPNDPEKASILFLDVIKENTHSQAENVKNNPKLLGIPNFSYYVEYLSYILKDVNANLPEEPEKANIVLTKFSQIKSEYKSLLREGDDEINAGIHQAIPEHFIDLCTDLYNYCQILLQRGLYDESEIMIDALEKCIGYTKKLYEAEEYRNLLKSI
jgi:chromosome segregation ATPase